MTKNILITGATDGIGLATAKILASQGHNLLIHGRNAAKLNDVEKTLSAISNSGNIESFVADLTNLNDVAEMANAVKSRYSKIDVLLNNAGVFRMADPITKDDMDARFVVNTISPYLLTQALLPIMDASSRIVNLSSAAQAPVNLDALVGNVKLSDEFEAYAQSKLAITMWTRALATQWGDNGPMIVAVNPGSMLASKMVKEGFGVAGNDLSIGSDILVRAALSEEFADASGKYFDNDARRFAQPHSEGLNDQKSLDVIKAVESVIGA